jgi:cytochrome c-type biogenesis protein CcmE
MSRKRLRLYLVIASLAVLGLAAFLVLRALDSELVFFLSPSDIAKSPPSAGQQIRIGGLVETGSVDKSVGDGVIAFSVTDLAENVRVNYRGILPDLFREGQGVVAHGRLQDGTFVADEILAKHDEKYMPPEVARSLKDNPPPPPAGT